MGKSNDGDEAAFDVHQTDPRRLKSEIKKDLGKIRTWECTECGEEIKSDKKPTKPSKCGAYGRWREIS